MLWSFFSFFDFWAFSIKFQDLLNSEHLLLGFGPVKSHEKWASYGRFSFFFQFLSTFHQVFRVLPLEKLYSLLNSKYFRLWMGEIAWKTSELCYFFCLIFLFFSTFHQIFRVWDWWNRMKNERVTVNIQIIKFWKNCNNKFIDPEEREKWTSLFTQKKEKNEQVNTDGEKTEKWTSLLILKRQKNEQVYWSWRDRKMNKFIAGKEREQGVTTVGPKK